ncbi:MAG: hypothetical protein NZO58_05055, partial [Gemmataceae bacterium]|nr:hypothetical protein [Gemmataceae bacterium]
LSRPLAAERHRYPPAVQRAVEQIAPGWTTSTGNLAALVDGVTTFGRRYAEATLQLQDWSLFAPNIGQECVFPAVVLAEAGQTPVAEGPQPGTYAVSGKVLLSDNEPPDAARYFRWGRYRLRRYESNVTAYLVPGEGERPEQLAQRWREQIRQYVSEHAEAILGYLRFRLARLNGPRPPRAILVMRRYHIRPPESGAAVLDGPWIVPLASWPTALGERSAARVLEYFDPVTRRFEPLTP